MGGATGSVELESGKQLRGMGRQIVPIGDRLIINMPGGGGFGNPKERDTKEILEDLKMGLVSFDAAQIDYGFPEENK